MTSSLATAALALTLAACPLALHAQGVVRGANDGAAAGERVGGPVGEIVGSVIGLFLGLGIAAGMNAVLKASGIDLPSAGIVFSTRTIVVSLAVGTLIELLASLRPAIRVKLFFTPAS